MKIVVDDINEFRELDALLIDGVHYVKKDKVLEMLDKWVQHLADKGEIKFLKSENTEGVSTTVGDESGVLHDVSDRNASRDEPTTESEVVVEGALALRTKPESVQCHNPLGCACFEANGWQDTGCDYWHA